jgi:hypothetical protein
MSLTRPPLTLIEPVGRLVPGNPVKSDGRQLVVTDPDTLADDLMLETGAFNSTTGVLTLNFKSGRKLEIGGFLTVSSVGRGEKGETGAAGKAGIDGKDGLNGRDGSRGWTGSQGLRGEKGESGVQGPVGVQGDKGEKGDVGPPGVDFTS